MIRISFMYEGKVIKKEFNNGLPQYWMVETIREWASKNPKVSGLIIMGGK